MSELYVSTVETEGFVMDYARFGHGDRTHVIIPGVSIKPVIPYAGAVMATHKKYLDDCTFYLFERKRDIGAGYGTEEMADDIASAMRYLGIDKADIRGVSQGGMIAEYIAAKYPCLVNCLCLCSTQYRQNDVSIDTFRTWVKLAESGDGAALAHDINSKVYSDEFRYRYRDALALSECGITKEETDRFAFLAEACLTHDASDVMGNIKCNTLAVGAELDRVISVIGTTEIAEKLGCESIVYKGASHAVYDEAKDYTDTVMSFCLGH